MDSTHLLYFKAIAEAESLTKAAHGLHISQPALSKCLSNLERELGCSLFNRIGGRLYLNSDGKALLEYAHQVDTLFGQIKERFSRRTEPGRHLTLCSVGNYFSFLLKNYFQYETRPLSLRILPSAQIPEALFSGEADIAIADDRFLRAGAESGLKKIPMISEQLLLMVPHGHPLCGRKTIDISELIPYPIMRLNTNRWIEELAEENRVQLNLSWSVDSETWSCYWNDQVGELPLCFDTSASFVTHNTLSMRRRRCDILKVEGVHTARMLHLWYRASEEKELAGFLSGVRESFL